MSDLGGGMDWKLRESDGENRRQGRMLVLEITEEEEEEEDWSSRNVETGRRRNDFYGAERASKDLTEINDATVVRNTESRCDVIYGHN